MPTSELPTFSRDPDISDNTVDDTRFPYFPFKTLADFEQTELFIKRDCADPFINEQLNLWRRYAPNSGVTLKNAREMHRCLWAAGTEDDLSQVVSQSISYSTSDPTDYLEFTRVNIQVPYERKRKTEMREYTIRSRPVLDTVRRALEDPGLRASLIYYPERHYVRKPGAGGNMRVWSDVHTADDWWEVQVIPLLSSHHTN
jgi:hypothetical protein